MLMFPKNIDLLFANFHNEIDLFTSPSGLDLDPEMKNYTYPGPQNSVWVFLKHFYYFI